MAGPWWERDVTCHSPSPEAKQQGILKLFVWVVSQVRQGWHILHHTLYFCKVEKEFCRPRMHFLLEFKKVAFFFFFPLLETSSVILSKKSTDGVQVPGNGSPLQTILGLASYRMIWKISCQSFPALPSPSKHSLGHIYLFKWIMLQGIINLPIIRQQLSEYKISWSKLSKFSSFLISDISDCSCCRGVAAGASWRTSFPTKREGQSKDLGFWGQVKWGSENS